MISFSNPKTAEKFEALTEHNHMIDVPVKQGAGCNCKAYSGLLSDITPCAAERYVASGGNLIKAKEAVADTAAPVQTTAAATQQSAATSKPSTPAAGADGGK